ncbi:hypothetical protein IW262DRAFT_198774 [Armillaria fumosa]|nr:hypothetical protein IW262DRAFT_198774 [Armillaria fumosa]
MDQAAIVELTCSLGRGASDPPTSWVAQQPFGYIKDTHLVGVVGHDGNLLTINYPFFGSDQTCSHLDPQDPTRTFFVCHTYQTTVHPSRPVTHLGVTCINQQHRMPPLELYTYASNEVLTLVGLPEARTASSSITYVHWAHLPEWIKKVLGEDWRAAGLGYVSVKEATTHASWRLERKRAKKSAYEPAIKIDVYVQSHTDADGVLDLAASKQATRHWLASILSSTSRHIKEVWTRGKLDEFGEYSVQYIHGGRFIVVAGPTIIDIWRDMERTVEHFEDYALKLLEHTIRRDSSALTAPVIMRGPLLSMQHDEVQDERSNKILVHSVDERFSLYFQLAKPIAAANATTEGWAFLFNKWVQDVAEDFVTVRLIFMVQEMGSHVVKVHFADSETLISRTQTIEVEVVE